MSSLNSILNPPISQETKEEARDLDSSNSTTPRIKTKLSALWINLKLTEDLSPSVSPTKEEAPLPEETTDLQEETTDPLEETETEAETEAEMEAEMEAETTTEEAETITETIETEEITETAETTTEITEIEETTTENQMYLANNPLLTSMSPTSLSPSPKPS